MCNPLLNDLVIDFDDEPGVDSAARDSDQSNSPDCFTHAIVNVRSCEIPRNMLQADTIVVSFGLANFEQSSSSTHRRLEFWGTHEELHTLWWCVMVVCCGGVLWWCVLLCCGGACVCGVW